MGGIFICYRRKDSGYIAGRMQRDLAEHFGADQVFLDGTGIKAGADFGERLGAQVNSCDALIAVIGDDWLTASQNGKRRLDEPKDWVRQEIASALARDILVVPVLVEDARPPIPADLPAALRGLTKRNCLELRAADWDHGMRQLTEALEDVVRPVAKPVAEPATAPPPAPDPAPAPVAAAAPTAAPTEPSRPLPFRPQFPGYGQPTAERPPAPSPGWAPPAPPSRPFPAPAEPGPAFPGWAKWLVPAVVLAVVAVGIVALSGGDDPGRDVTPPSVATSVRTDPGGSTPTTAATAPPDTTPQVRTIEGPWTGTESNLSLIVEKVEVGSTIRLFLLVRNRLRTAVTLPTYGYFTAVDNSGKSYSVVSEDWARTFPPGETRGRIDLGGPAGGATTLKIGFTTVFSSDFSVDDIYVERIRLA